MHIKQKQTLSMYVKSVSCLRWIKPESCDSMSHVTCFMSAAVTELVSSSGYVQGMSDLLSPILYVMENEVDAFWCFVSFMDQVVSLDSHMMSTLLYGVYTVCRR